MILNFYRLADAEIAARIRAFNPEFRNPTQTRVGQTILLPVKKPASARNAMLCRAPNSKFSRAKGGAAVSKYFELMQQRIGQSWPFAWRFGCRVETSSAE